jgi:2-oxoglutarate ferredoxin oxidoreductase subunit delta
MAESKAGAPKDPPRKAKLPPVIEVKVSWCKGCGLCVDYCNLGVLEMNGTLPKVVKVEKCSRCMQCEVICPDFAISVTDGKVSAEPAEAKKEQP